jgi:hypothetical protein
MTLKTSSMFAAALLLAAALGAPLELKADGGDAPAELSLSAATAQDLSGAFAAYLSSTGKSTLSVAASGFREFVTGERSSLCANLERELNAHLRNDTPYGVPSVTELEGAWNGIGGNGSDIGSQTYALRKFGRLAGVDLVVSGYYTEQSKGVSITVRLLNCDSGTELWAKTSLLPKGAVPKSDLDRMSGSEPQGWGQEPAAVSAPVVIAGGSPESASALSPSATAVRPIGDFSPQGTKRDANHHETEFSVDRIDFELAYQYFDPTTAAVKYWAPKGMSGPCISVNWADIVHLDYTLWYLASVPNFSAPVSSVMGWGFSIYGTAPVRLGHHWVLYAGVGGRFETIDINSPSIPSGDTISFGNNAFFGVAGAKVHWGDLGVDGALTDDFTADYAPYFTARLGLYYEYEFAE